MTTSKTKNKEQDKGGRRTRTKMEDDMVESEFFLGFTRDWRMNEKNRVFSFILFLFLLKMKQRFH